MDKFADDLADLCSGAPKFNFLPVKYDKPATFKWKDEPSHVPARPAEDWRWKRARSGGYFDLMCLARTLNAIIQRLHMRVALTDRIVDNPGCGRQCRLTSSQLAIQLCIN